MNKNKIYSVVGTVLVIILGLFVFSILFFPYQVGEFFGYLQSNQKISSLSPSTYLVPGKVPDGYKLTSTIPLNGYDSEYNYSSGKSDIQFREVGGYKSFDDYVKSWTESNGTVVKEFTHNGNRGVVISVAASPSGPAYYELGYKNDIFVERIISDSSLTPDTLIDILKGMEVRKR